MSDFNVSLGSTSLTDNTGAVEYHHFDSLSSFSNLNINAATVQQIINVLPNRSILTLPVINSSNKDFPEANGLLEIRKPTMDFINCLFTTASDSYTRVYVNKTLSAWRASAAIVPVGTVVAWGAKSTAEAPMGWVKCDGARYRTDYYPALFAVLGYTWGGEEHTDFASYFNVPDFRGVFLRGYNNSTGTYDKNRKLGTIQTSGAPNITGQGPEETWSAHNFETVNGAFYNIAFSGKISMGGGGAQEGNIVAFDASKSSSVYQNDLTEVRPVNQAVWYIIKY